MKNQESRVREQGFTLIEVLVVAVILLMVTLMAAPYLATQIQRSKLIGAANQAVGVMRMARMDAIKNSQCAMVLIDPAQGLVEALSDRDANCVPSAPDVRVGQAVLPKNVTFSAPGGGTGESSIKGFDVPGSPRMAVFQGDGSVKAVGAFRFEARELGGRKANWLEVNVAPTATARIEVRKWKGPDNPGAAVDADANWHANGEGGGWTWN